MTSRSHAPLGLPIYLWRLLLAAAIVGVLMLSRGDAAEAPCAAVAAPSQPSWIFRPSRYTHDPETGNRVAQYDRKPAIEPLDDPRAVTSGYSRTRTIIRGPDGSVDTHYRVQSYGNGRGGMDAEWERFHDAWRGSTIAGGAYQASYPPFGFGGFGAYGGYGGYATPYANGGGFDGQGYGGGYGYGAGRGAPLVRPGVGYGPGYGVPDAGLLDPDAADGYREERRRVPDRAFFNGGLPPREREHHEHDHDD